MNTTKIMNFLAKGNKWQFDIPLKKQLKYLNHFENPQNDIQRSFFQYKCQMVFISYIKRLIFNFIAILILPLFLILAFILRINSNFKYKVNAIVERSSHKGIIPNSLNLKFNINYSEWDSGFSFGFSDIPFIIKFFPYFFKSPYFVFKILYKSSCYSKLIKQFKPDVIIVYNEYSFTSSALTYYCEKKNVQHINVMHGEKLFYIRDSFFRFTICYVWDEYYIQLFTKLRAPKEQFIAEKPPFMSINPKLYQDPDNYADYKYYLARYNEEELKKILESLSFIIKRGGSLKFRPHPRYSNIDLLKKYVTEDYIEDPFEVDIQTSISNLKYGIGVYTTVLNQCYNAGKGVILDNLNFQNNFSLLKDLGYILMNKNLLLLSNLQ